MIGKAIGTYKILRELGVGPHGTVYEAADQARNQVVALKALRPELTRQAVFKQNLRSLSARLAQLQHPHLATFYTILQVGSDFYLVSEFINGTSLTQTLQQTGVLPCEQAVKLAAQALAALQHAHQSGFVHGGVRPDNILLTATGELKLTDLGLAQAALPQPVELGLSTAVLNYVAPEQIHGSSSDARADVYALGAVLYEMITGLPPFRRANHSALLKAQLEETPPSPRQYFPLIPLPIETALLRALAKMPEARFQSAEEFRETLLRWQPGESEPETSPTVNLGALRTTMPAAVPTPFPEKQVAPPVQFEPEFSSAVADTAQLPFEPLEPQEWPQFSASARTLLDNANGSAAPTLRELPSGSSLHDEVIVELDESHSTRRSFWKPLVAVTGVATLLGASYAMVRLNNRPATTGTPNIVVKLSPTPAVTADPDLLPSANTEAVAAASLVAAPTETPRPLSSPPAKVTVSPKPVALNPVPRKAPAPKPIVKPTPVLPAKAKTMTPVAPLKAKPPTPVPGKSAGKAKPTPVPTVSNKPKTAPVTGSKKGPAPTPTPVKLKPDGKIKKEKEKKKDVNGVGGKQDKKPKEKTPY